MVQNHAAALDQLEKLQYEKSLQMETPAGELREQVKSLANTVEDLTSHNKDLQDTLEASIQTIQQLKEDKKKLQYGCRWMSDRKGVVSFCTCIPLTALSGAGRN